MTLGDIENAVLDHMRAQPYEIKCNGCGRELGHEADPDSDGDLCIEVTPCETCLDGAREEAKQEAEA